MIAQISGKLAQKQPGEVVIDVGGVGYQVFIPLNVFYRLPDIGAPMSLQIHTHVREDALQLFGEWDGFEFDPLTIECRGAWYTPAQISALPVLSKVA